MDATLFTTRGVTLATLGTAYLVFLGTLAATAALFVWGRRALVVSPNDATRHYGVHVSVALTALLIAIALENELLPSGTATLHYVVIPQLFVLLALHVAIWRRQEPWLVTLGAAATTGTLLVGVLLATMSSFLGPGYYIVLVLLAGLLATLWHGAISTQRGFASARSIYVASKESRGAPRTAQKPWLGLAQWVALAVASVGLATANSVLRGRGLEEVPAVEVAGETGLLLLATALVCLVPAGSYWLTRKAWMPELTRFVWLAWMVVGFAMTYGNYLSTLTLA
jgi:hypothetical protein